MALIARTLGVSVQTVSAVVNNKPGISSDTQARVRAAIDRLDYQPNAHARTLRGIKTKTLGVIIPSITNPYFPEFVKGIEEGARKRGYSIFLCNTDSELTHLLDYFSLIEANKVSGLICSVGIAGEWLSHPEVTRRIRKFADDDVAVVLNGRFSENLPAKSVLIDSTKAMQEAARHLLELGHRRIGVISPPKGLSVSGERVGGYRAAFVALGHPLDETLIVPGDFDIGAGVEGVRQLMRSKRRPTAIIAANDIAAFGAISELHAMGLRVPQDISVVGFDDIAFAKVFQPALTTIFQPVFDLGQQALRLATSAVPADGEPGELVVLEATFMPRKSTAPVS